MTTAAGIVVLWLVTLLVSDAPFLVVTAFWLVVGVVIGLWVRHDMRQFTGQFETIVSGLESALRRDTAEIYSVQAVAFAEFEEVEDEGASYAFELANKRLVFISGQEFYASANFPSLDFSLVYVLNEDGRPVEMLIEKRGSKARPAKTIPAALKRRATIPDHLATRAGSVDEIEGILHLTSAD